MLQAKLGKAHVPELACILPVLADIMAHIQCSIWKWPEANTYVT